MPVPRQIRPALAIVFVIAVAQLSYGVSPCDSFQYRTGMDSAARVDGCAVAVARFPESVGFLLVYGSGTGMRGELAAHIQGLRRFLARRWPTLAGRLKVVSGGYRAQVEVDFWIVPPGAVDPESTPYIKSGDIRLKGTFRRRNLYPKLPPVRRDEI